MVQGNPIACFGSQVAGVFAVRRFFDDRFGKVKTLLITPAVKVLPGSGKAIGDLLALPGGRQLFQRGLLAREPIGNPVKRLPGIFEAARFDPCPSHF